MKFGDKKTLAGSALFTYLYGLHSDVNFEQMADSLVYYDDAGVVKTN